MPTTFEKLNLKTQTEILVLNAPESFEPELAALEGVAVLRAIQQAKTITFSLAFVTQQAQVDAIAAAIAPKAQGDVVIWFAYPKGNSKKYRCEFNRDTGWAVLGALGFEGVRQIAIDEDWSALRFRRVEFIKTMARDTRRAMTRLGKEKVARP
jgi:hypothetical protein